jgi:hypothetical protein
MPRPYKPATIYMNPVSQHTTATCPLCEEVARAKGVVATQVVYCCAGCGAHFKPYRVGRVHAWDS